MSEKNAEKAIREFGTRTTGVVDALKRRQGTAKPEPAVDWGHGCDDGWKYDENGDAYPCPECEREKQLRRAEEQIGSSGIGPRYLGLEWADLELVDPLPRVKDACARIDTVIEAGESALFHGKPGTGKTQAAVLLVKATIRAGYTARVENLGRLGVNIRAGYDDRLKGPSEARVVDLLSRVDLLVFDDIGAGETSNAAIEQRILYLVTEARQNAVKPTVITTNLGTEAFAKNVGQRIVNRLMPLTTIAFSHGRNFRRPASHSGGAW